MLQKVSKILTQAARRGDRQHKACECLALSHHAPRPLKQAVPAGLSEPGTAIFKVKGEPEGSGTEPTNLKTEQVF